MRRPEPRGEPESDDDRGEDVAGDPTVGTRGTGDGRADSAAGYGEAAAAAAPLFFGSGIGLVQQSSRQAS